MQLTVEQLVDALKENDLAEALAEKLAAKGLRARGPRPGRPCPT